MHAINASYKGGQVVLDEKADWPEDTKLRVEAVAQEQNLGIREEDWPTDPAGIAKLLALIDSLEPLEITPEEEARWAAALKDQKEYDVAKSDERLQRIIRSFE